MSMNNTFFSIIRREWKTAVHSLLPYIFILVTVISLGWLFWQNAFIVSQTSMRSFFSLLPWFFLFLMPAVSMRLWSDEIKSGTTETVFSLPISPLKAVLAKYIATLGILVLILLVSIVFPLVLSTIGELDWGVVLSSYIGAFLLGAAIIGIGQWMSATTENQIIALLLSIVITFIFLLFGLPGVNAGTGLIPRILFEASFMSHYGDFIKGAVSIADIFYFLGISSISIFATVMTLYKRQMDGDASMQHFKKRFFYNTQIIAGVVLLIVLFIASLQLPGRIDMTEGNIYTLAPATKNVLSAIEDGPNQNGSIEITAFMTESIPQNLIPVADGIRDLLDQYANQDRLVSVEYIDPAESAEAIERAESFGIPEIQFNVYGGDSFEAVAGYMGIGIEYVYDEDQVNEEDGNTEVTDSEEADSVLENIKYRSSIPVITDTTTLEYDITVAIQKMIRTEIPTIGILGDHGAVPTTALQEILSKQYSVQLVTIENINELQYLIIPGATEAFTEQELFTIDQFVMNGGHLYVLGSGTQVDPSALTAIAQEQSINALLSSYGLRINTDMVADFASSETVTVSGGIVPLVQNYPVWVRITEGLNDTHPITNQLESATLLWPSSVSVDEGVDAQELLRTTERGQIVSYEQGIGVDAFDISGELGQQLVGVYLEGEIESAYAESVPEGVDAADDRPTSTSEGTIMVVGEAQWIGDGVIERSTQNAAVLFNAIDYEAQDFDLSSIRSRGALSRPLDFTTEQEQQLIRFGSLAVVIVLVGFGGLSAILFRKRASRRAIKQYGI